MKLREKCILLPAMPAEQSRHCSNIAENYNKMENNSKDRGILGY